MIDYFIGEYAPFSNFYVSSDQVFYAGRFYTNIETPFQMSKTLLENERKFIRESTTPSIARRRGKQCTLRPDWEQVKCRIMYQLVVDKFTQNQEFAELLLATGEEHLQEGNYWNETYWGVCDGQGQNKLGLILMDVRALLANANRRNILNNIIQEERERWSEALHKLGRGQWMDK